MKRTGGFSKGDTRAIPTTEHDMQQEHSHDTPKVEEVTFPAPTTKLDVDTSTKKK